MGYDVFKSMMQDGFLMESCKSLIDPSLTGNANIIARQYLDANRIKQWKPLNPDAVANKNTNSNITYCYFNNDLGNDLKDYAMSARDCNKGEGIFNIPFITDVFEDATLDKTMTHPVNKCVIKIDKSKISTDGLTTFWDGLGQSECKQLNTPLSKSLAETKSALVNCNDAKQQAYTAYETCSADKRVVTDKLTGANARIGELDASKRVCDENYAAESRKYAQCSKDYGNFKKDAWAESSKQKENITILGDSLKAAKDDKAVCQTRNEILNKEYVAVSDKLLNAEKELATANGTVEILQGRVNFVTQERVKYEKNYNACNAALGTIKQQADECNAELEEYKPLGLKYPECDTQRTACMQNLQLCRSDMETKQKDLDGAMLSLTKTLRENASLVASNKAMTAELERLRDVAALLRDCKANLAEREARLETLTDDVKKYLAELTKLRGKLSTLEEASASVLMASVEKQLNVVCANSSIKRENEKYVKQVADLTSQVRNLATTSDNCHVRLRACQTELEDKKINLEKRTKERDTCNTNYANLEQLYGGALSENRRLTTQLDECNRAIAPLRKNLDDMTTDRNNWKGWYYGMEADRNAWKNAFYSVEADRNKWYAWHGDRTYERDVARGERDGARGERDAARGERDELQGHVNWFRANWDERYWNGYGQGVNDGKARSKCVVRLFNHGWEDYRQPFQVGDTGGSGACSPDYNSWDQDGTLRWDTRRYKGRLDFIKVDKVCW